MQIGTLAILGIQALHRVLQLNINANSEMQHTTVILKGRLPPFTFIRGIFENPDSLQNTTPANSHIRPSSQNKASMSSVWQAVAASQGRLLLRTSIAETLLQVSTHIKICSPAQNTRLNFLFSQQPPFREKRECHSHHKRNRVQGIHFLWGVVLERFSWLWHDGWFCTVKI